MKGRVREILKKFVMFVLCSGVGTLVDLSIHWLLSSLFFKESYLWSYWITPLISFEFAVTTNFFIAYHFVWRERISHRDRRSFWRHYAAYNATATGVFFIKLGLMQGFHFLFPVLIPVLCNLLALCLSGFVNFTMSEFVIFAKKKQKEDDGREKR